MMDEIEIDDKYLIVIINNIKGNIQRLNLILEKLKNNLEIEYLILTGEVFNSQSKEEDIHKISFKGNIIIFDSSYFGEAIKAKNGYNTYISKNIIFLGKSGIFSLDNSSINIAFLNGLESKEFLEKNSDQLNLPYSNKFYKYKDIEKMINNYLEIKTKNNNIKIDFFLINNFPQSLYNRYFNSIKNDSIKNNISLNEEEINNSISYSINYLLYIMNPRYLITSVDDFFYKNTNDNILNERGYRTFFYNLGYMEDKKNINENFYIALDFKSLNDMDENEISSIEKNNEEMLGLKFIKDNNIFKYFSNYEIDMRKTLIQNFDDYLKLCFTENKIKSIKEMIPEAKPLFLSDINFNSTEEEIKNYLIKRYGPIKQIKFLKNKDNNKFNGKAIVQFSDINSMKAMLLHSRNEKFKDRTIKSIIYTPRDQLNNNNINNNSKDTNNKSFISNKSNDNNNKSSNNDSLNLSKTNSENNNNNFNKSLNNENINLSKNNDNKNDCWFCYDKKDDIEKRYILQEFQNFYLSFSKGPINKYHFLIIPKKHVSFYINLSFEEKIECEMIIKLLKEFLNYKGYNFIIFEKNLRYNFSKSVHLLINVVGIENFLIKKINEFSENFIIEEKLNNYIVVYNDKNLYYYEYEKNDEYIYINIPKVFKEQIIRKIMILKTKEYKIDYPRKLVCLLINREDRINWRDTLNTEDDFVEEIKKDIKDFLNNFFAKI